MNYPTGRRLNTDRRSAAMKRGKIRPDAFKPGVMHRPVTAPQRTTSVRTQDALQQLAKRMVALRRGRGANRKRIGLRR